MLLTDLAEIIRNGENSGVEFKRDDVRPDDLAKEIAALANLEGGYVLLGVEDDGSVSGLVRDPKAAEEWVVNICRNNLQPPMIPFWETLKQSDGKAVAAITVPADSPDKPYKAKRGAAWVTFVRVGTTSREATREEEARLYQASGLVRYDLRPVPGAALADLDMRRLADYFRNVLHQDCPDADDTEAWTGLLLNVDILVEDRDRAIPTVAGVLLFGTAPNRFLPQAGVTATAYPGTDKEYAMQDEEVIRGPLVRLGAPSGRAARGGGRRGSARVMVAREDASASGVIDRAIEFVWRNIRSTGKLDRGVRRVTQDLPEEAIREAIVNAVTHRDYTLAMTDVEVSVYGDRLEVVSPGRLPNSVTVEKMKRGYRAARNELLKDILRDYDYVEHRGMGVRNRIIAGMLKHNGTEPDLVEDEDRFIVRLWKTKAGA